MQRVSRGDGSVGKPASGGVVRPALGVAGAGWLRRLGGWRQVRRGRRSGRPACPLREGGFTLVELLVVIAIIVLLLAILLPSLNRARAQAMSAVCASNLHQLGVAMHAYSGEEGDWLPGSPHTSGNGAYFGSRRNLEDGSAEQYAWDPMRDAWPAVHAFDWAGPLMPYLGTKPPRDRVARYRLGREGVFLCPSNRKRLVSTNIHLFEQTTTQACSYATCKWFTYLPGCLKTGVAADGYHHGGGTYWVRPQVPVRYRPTLGGVGNASRKIFLADAHRANRALVNPGEAGLHVDNYDLGYTTHGAWAMPDGEPATADLSLSYRWEPARSWAFRHTNGINAVFFDSHVAHLDEGDSDANEGYGSGARTAEYWYPAGMDTGSLSGLGNEPIVVP